MPNANTFDVLPIGNFVRRYLANSKVSVDPFARNKRWATYTNDLNPETAAEWHLDALEFLETLREKDVRADLGLFDPVYSLRQLRECYDNLGRKLSLKDTRFKGSWTLEKDLLASLIEVGGIVLSFGWNTIGMGKQRGFEAMEVLMVVHGGAHHDTLCIAERKVQARLGDYGGKYGWDQGQREDKTHDGEAVSGMR